MSKVVKVNPENVVINEGEVLLYCGEIAPKFKKFFVKTTDKEIKDMIKRVHSSTREENNNVFKSVYFSLMKYSEEQLIKLFEGAKEQEYHNWCSDVALFYVYRLYLSDAKLQIPIARM
jgi:hypothetical protein